MQYNSMSDLFKKRDYRDYLLEILEERSRRNSKYSLRAFARDLEVGPSKLSEVLNNKQGLSRTTAKEIALKLGLNASEEEYFSDLVILRHGRSRREKEAAEIRLKKKWALLQADDSVSANEIVLPRSFSREKVVEVVKEIKRLVNSLQTNGDEVSGLLSEYRIVIQHSGSDKN